MSNPTQENDTDGAAAKPQSRESRSFEAAMRLSRLLARPLGTPAPADEPPLEPRELPPRPVVRPKPAEAAAAAAPAPDAAAPSDLDAPPELPPSSDEPDATAKPVESVAAEPPVEIAAARPFVEERSALPSSPPEPTVIARPKPASPSRASTTEAPSRPAPDAAVAPSDASTTAHLGKIRRLMLVSNLFMLIAVAAVLGVIGYRVFHSEANVAPPTAPLAPAPAPAQPPLEMTLSLPHGAKVVQTGIADDRIVITIDIGGALEIRTFDAKTLQPVGRMTFATAP